MEQFRTSWKFQCCRFHLLRIWPQRRNGADKKFNCSLRDDSANKRPHEGLQVIKIDGSIAPSKSPKSHPENIVHALRSLNTSSILRRQRLAELASVREESCMSCLDACFVPWKESTILFNIDVTVLFEENFGKDVMCKQTTKFLPWSSFAQMNWTTVPVSRTSKSHCYFPKVTCTTLGAQNVVHKKR